jgi:hypothetical protein
MSAAIGGAVGSKGERAADAAYLSMLAQVAELADRIGPRVIASHWPFVGTDYRRLLVVGQALAGWDDKTSPALWTPAAVATPAGRSKVLAATKAWALARAEPISEPLRTRHSPFWSLSERLVAELEPAGRGLWYSREAWWNLFPLGWGDTNKSPDGPLWIAQVEYVAALFWAVVDLLDPDRIVILAGKGYWDAMGGALGLDDLPELEWPLIAGGVRDNRAIVWTRHPGGYLRVSHHLFAAAIAKAIRNA